MGIFDIFKNKQTDKGLSAIELNNKGTELLGQNRIDDAIICFDKALKINPELIELWINKGVCLIKKRRNNEALECYDRALEINPEHGMT